MRVRIGGAVGLVAAAILVACSGDDQPSLLPDATPTNADSAASDVGSPSPSGDPTAQVEAEITEFIHEYDEVIDASWTSQDALIKRREMFADSCAPCLRGYELTREALADGLLLEAEFGTIRSVRVDAVDGDVVTFLVIDDVPAARLVNEAGEVVRKFEATLGTQIVYQARKSPSEQWILISSEVLSVEGGGPS